MLDDMRTHTRLDDAGRNTNVNGCLYFVAGEDPDLHASITHELDRFGDFVLKFVLDSRRSNEYQISLHLDVQVTQLLASILNGSLGFLNLGVPLLVHICRDDFLRKKQCS